MSGDMDIRPEEKEARVLVARTSAMENEAKALVVTDNASYEAAGKFKIFIKEERDKAMAKFLEKKKAASGLHKFLSDICNMIQRPFDNAEGTVDQIMIGYRRDVERKRQEEARKAQEKAEAEAKKKRAAEIAKAKEQGDKEAAKNLKAAPIHVEAVAPKTPEAPKISGVPTRKIWRYQIDDNKLDRKYMVPDEVTIGKVVRALGAAHGISGVTAYQEEVQ